MSIGESLIVSKKRRLGITIALLCVLGCALACLIFYTVTMRSHDLRREEYAAIFRNMEHPPGTSGVDVYSEVAHTSFPREPACEYLVAEVRAYTSTQEEIRAFYADVTLEGRWIRDIGLLFTDTGRFPTPCNPDEPIPFDFVWSEVCRWAGKFEGNLYAVYAVGGGDLPGWDPRCHFNH